MTHSRRWGAAPTGPGVVALWPDPGEVAFSSLPRSPRAAPPPGVPRTTPPTVPPNGAAPAVPRASGGPAAVPHGIPSRPVPSRRSSRLACRSSPSPPRNPTFVLRGPPRHRVITPFAPARALTRAALSVRPGAGASSPARAAPGPASAAGPARTPPRSGPSAPLPRAPERSPRDRAAGAPRPSDGPTYPEPPVRNTFIRALR
jgi:hypothetical protein